MPFQVGLQAPIRSSDPYSAQVLDYTFDAGTSIADDRCNMHLVETQSPAGMAAQEAIHDISLLPYCFGGESSNFKS